MNVRTPEGPTVVRTVYTANGLHAFVLGKFNYEKTCISVKVRIAYKFFTRKNRTEEIIWED